MDYIYNIFIGHAHLYVIALLLPQVVIYLVHKFAPPETKRLTWRSRLKLSLVCLLVPLVTAMLSPVNTPKVENSRSPVIQRQSQQEMKPSTSIDIKRQEDLERKQKFDEMVDWKNRSN